MHITQVLIQVLCLKLSKINKRCLTVTKMNISALDTIYTTHNHLTMIDKECSAKSSNRRSLLQAKSNTGIHFCLKRNCKREHAKKERVNYLIRTRNGGHVLPALSPNASHENKAWDRFLLSLFDNVCSWASDRLTKGIHDIAIPCVRASSAFHGNSAFWHFSSKSP